MDKFQNKYRIESARLNGWDYGKNAWYFVTICTGGRNCFFGEIIDMKMKYSPAGDIARQLWMEIPNQFGYANLDEYIVMPNHIHGIIQINKPNSAPNPHPEKYNRLENNMGVGDGAGDGICTDGATGHGRDAINRVSTTDDRTTAGPNSDRPTTNDPNLDGPTTDNANSNGRTTNDPKSNDPTPKIPGGITGKSNPILDDNLSRIIRWYKGRVSFEVRKTTDTFSWQSRFHDRIIRNEKQLNRVRKYIANNPRNWKNDEWYVL